MITLYGQPRSSAGRCFWCLEELGISYEVKKVDFHVKEHKSPEYLRINPNGKVPALEDGDLIIWESMAINFYLAEKYRSELMGADLENRAAVYQWSFWALSELQPPIIETFIQKVFVPEERRDHGLIEKCLKKIPPLLEVLNESLGGKEYLTGGTFTLADLNTFSVVNICRAINVDFDSYTNIHRWSMNLMKRPAFQKFNRMNQ